MYDIVGKRRYYFIFSAALTVPGLLFILLGGLRPSIDFTGGTVWQVRHADRPTADEMRDALASLGHPDAVVSEQADGYVQIRTEPIGLLPPETADPAPAASSAPPGSPASTAEATQPAASPSAPATAGAGASPTAAPTASAAPEPVAGGTEFAALQAELAERFGEADIRQATTVGPIVGAELIRSSAILIIVGELFILLYLWLRFGFRFGTAAIVALLHDVIIVVGFFAIGGFFFGLEFDALFITALLTIIGFSVHDTIVVFDRIRENRIRHAGEPFGAIVNHSILQTLARSVNTSMTVVITLTALLLLGPASIQSFTLALLIGVISGTYSSIFNASQLLVAWYEWEARRKASRASARPARAAAR